MNRQASAKLNYLKITPRKTRLVADVIKGLPVQEAEAQLLVRPQRAAGPLLKLLRSAVANAKNKELDVARLFVASVRVDQGPMSKRTLPRAMGRATLVQKKTSHIILVLEELAEAPTQRFNIEIIKKEKKPKKEAKSKPKKEKEEEKDKVAPKEKPGFFKKVFKRKSV